MGNVKERQWWERGGGSKVCREWVRGQGEVGIIVCTPKKGLDFLQKCLDGGGYPCGIITLTFGLCSAPER